MSKFLKVQVFLRSGREQKVYDEKKAEAEKICGAGLSDEHFVNMLVKIGLQQLVDEKVVEDLLSIKEELGTS